MQSQIVTACTFAVNEAEAEYVRFYHLQVLRKGGRVMKETVTTAATLNCIERLRRLRPPCRLHLQLSLYRVGAAEVKAAQQHQQLSSQVLTNCKSLSLGNRATSLASTFRSEAGLLCKKHMLCLRHACHVSSNSAEFQEVHR